MSQCKSQYKECEETYCFIHPRFSSTDLKGIAAIQKKLRCSLCSEKDCHLRYFNKYQIILPSRIYSSDRTITKITCKFNKKGLLF